MSLEVINSATPDQARHMFRQCCTSEAWINRMVSARPYASDAELREAADIHWQGLTEDDYLEAFEGHPKIGDVSSLKKKYANTKELAAGEQSGVNVATDEIIQDLADGNTGYEKKFGFIFIVCATGKSAQEMSCLLQTRLVNSRDVELSIAVQEQQKIFQIRLEKLL
jgi:2-oxo-4-hydroxy-4-carboxy-5-ureidoimidazoline decarboxylase